MKPLACYKYGKGKNGVYINTPPLSESGAKYLVTLLDKSKNGTVELWAMPVDKNGNPTHKLVPTEPTEEITKEGEKANFPYGLKKGTYKAMNEAAPKIEDIQP